MSDSAQRLLEELDTAEKKKGLKDKKEKKLKAKKDALQRKEDIERHTAFERTRALLSATLLEIEKLYENNRQIRIFLDILKNSKKSCQESVILWHKLHGKLGKSGGSCGAGNDPGESYYYEVDKDYKIVFAILNLRDEDDRNYYERAQKEEPFALNANTGFCLVFCLNNYWQCGNEGPCSLYNAPTNSWCLQPWKFQVSEESVLKGAIDFLKRLSDQEYLKKVILENEGLKEIVKAHIKDLKK